MSEILGGKEDLVPHQPVKFVREGPEIATGKNTFHNDIAWDSFEIQAPLEPVDDAGRLLRTNEEIIVSKTSGSCRIRGNPGEQRKVTIVRIQQITGIPTRGED